ncbi:MAG: RelA/SpoT domain-containing protein [Marinomonas sp.]
MASRAYQSQKRTLTYSKKQIEKAGKSIRYEVSGLDREEAILKIQNFRETHLYPLMLIKNHVAQTTKKVSKEGIVARRLKMLSTILDKLERPTLGGDLKNTIKVTEMQDIGGCRAIVSDLNQLNALHKRLAKSKSIHQIVKTYDYLKPKNSGYSGIHLVYSCFLGAVEESEWKKTKIEVQLRTKLQHAWATSLEIIDTLENIKLKTSQEGHPKWRRFFKLSGDLVAHQEKSNILGDDKLGELIDELKLLELKLGVRRKLSEHKTVIEVVTNKKVMPRQIQEHTGLFLVSVVYRYDGDRVGGKVFTVAVIKPYDQWSVRDALNDLAEKEKDRSVKFSVLVSAEDVKSLEKAYPNFLGSTEEFQGFLTKYIDGFVRTKVPKEPQNKLSQNCS